MNTLEEYFQTYGATGQTPPADAGLHTAQRAPSENFAWKQPDYGLEEGAGQDGLMSLLGAQGGLGSRSSQFADAAPVPDMSQYAQVGGIIDNLNKMGHRGQQPYENFMSGMKNPYIQKLINGG